ncbi:hypothetical protein BDZ97DRAFT_2007540 [Flammula alnicola]|nr:hypothetical protein BDZ97DRAFT_2007540 [Flammula alnicola]
MDIKKIGFGGCVLGIFSRLDGMSNLKEVQGTDAREFRPLSIIYQEYQTKKLWRRRTPYGYGPIPAAAAESAAATLEALTTRVERRSGNTKANPEKTSTLADQIMGLELNGAKECRCHGQKEAKERVSVMMIAMIGPTWPMDRDHVNKLPHGRNRTKRRDADRSLAQQVHRATGVERHTETSTVTQDDICSGKSGYKMSSRIYPTPPKGT